MTLEFTKMNGAGNDFVLVDNRDRSLSLTTAQIAALCDRHRGIGADGLLAVEPAEGSADFRMRYYNADGGEAEMCGNGARCFARFANRLRGSETGRIAFETMAGVIESECLGNLVRLRMSDPHSHQAPVPLEIGDQRRVEVAFLNTGVPHAVAVVDDLEAVEIRRDGSTLRYHPHFAPKGTNVNFVAVEAPGTIAIRTYERGVEDETLACGTGVVASALIHHLASGATSPIAVRVRGGDVLEVGFERSDDGGFSGVTLTGPADFVFTGAISLS